MSLKTRKKLSKEEIAKITKYQNNLKNELNMAQTFCEYLLIIGIDPRISMRTYLYDTDPNEILKFYSNEIKPEILSKYPPMKKNYINIDNNIIDLCFPNGFNLQEFTSKPEPETLTFLLDNYFYSIDYPHKYITCLKFYENLESYQELQNQLQKKLGINYDGKIPKYDGGASNVNRFLDDENDREELLGNLSYDSNKSDELGGDIILKKKKDKLKNLYFPKIICLISLHPFYKEQELILKQLYNYYLSKEKKIIPLEKIILNILCNIPKPPNGLFEISYKFSNDGNENNNNEVKIRRHKHNELKNIDFCINFMLSIFNIDNLLEIFKYSIYEIKTLIFSSEINNLCIFTNGILSLLYPFNYTFQVSSCIPSNAFDVLETISPYIFGINQQYKESFFNDNKIEINDVDIMIIDIDNKKLIFKIGNKENYPDLPRSYFKKLKSGIEDCIKKQKSLNKVKNNEENNLFSSIFFELFLSIMNEYSNYLNNDYFINKSKYKSSSIQGLFKVKEFINNHSSNEKNFVQKLVNSQMFSDFIFKKMLPKNINDKMDILFFDENINKKNNDKILLFGKKKAIFFINSTEYQYKHVYNVPKVKELSLEEKNRYSNKNYKVKNLFLGQDIESELNSNTNEEDYIFNYILFPVLNNDYFYAPNYDYHFSTMSNDIDRINTDILSKSHLSLIEGNDGGMLNYILLAYIEAWGYSYYYQLMDEKDHRFNQLISVLDRVYHHEIELFNIIFESLNKFQENEKILRLYERLLSYKITPNSFIYSIISKIIDKGKNKRIKDKEEEKEENDIQKMLNSSLLNTSNNKYNIELQRRTFRDENEKNIFGDLVTFKTTQMCPECGKIIDIENISMNYKNMKKDSFWAQCPLCNKYILPHLTVKLGNDVNYSQNDKGVKSTRFILHSPYELKVNLKETINKNGYQYLDVENFKTKYPSLFWSCIWYFRLNKIDYDIILPYESNIFQSKINNSNNFQANIHSIIRNDKNKDKNNSLTIIKDKKKLNKIRRYKYKIIIQDVFSFYYINNKFYKYNLGIIKDGTRNNNTIVRRNTCINYNTYKNYTNSITEFLNTHQPSNKNDKEKNDNDSEWIKLKEKLNSKFLKNMK